MCVRRQIGKGVVFFKSGLIEDVIAELAIRTVWDTSKHPHWLVFEVENGIQIRQDQYKVAQHLIDNPGDVVQLNMGLGKVSFMLKIALLLSLYCFIPVSPHLFILIRQE